MAGATIEAVIPPFDKARLAERNARDDAEAIADAAAKTAEERIAETLELSQLVLELARANGVEPTLRPVGFGREARLWARPMQLLVRQG
jgi:hypothetical protein